MALPTLGRLVPWDPEHPEVDPGKSCFVFSNYAGMVPWYGAPVEKPFWEQLQDYDPVMLAGCLLFWIPGILHLISYAAGWRRRSRAECALLKKRDVGCRGAFHRAWFRLVERYGDWDKRDLFCGITLCCVGVSSPCCDAICRWSAIMEANPETGEPWPEGHTVIANDYLNNLTRGADRATCIVVFVALLFFRASERPGFDRKLRTLVGWMSAALVVCNVDQSYRRINDCNMELDSWVMFRNLHTLWHVMLTAGFLWNWYDSDRRLRLAPGTRLAQTGGLGGKV